ncbi:DEAD/DEAH box helicase [Xanthobacter autotrophicus]|uniref:DEAD/DEAH box helicase n=1 Tax=Xanthobacter autotrophicus TaxID=280 RepID=UPI00372CA634
MPVPAHQPRLTPLDDRFVLPEAAVAPGDREALRSSIFEVEERATGSERTLKLWRKMGGDLDQDLRELWRHEMRQVTRIMAYAGARDVIVDILEFVEDEDNFGVLLERVGQPLAEKRKRVGREHWLRILAAPRPRALLWRNIRRVVTALGIVHAQGLVHGAVGEHAIMTEGADQPDFQLGGFEWCLALSSAGASHADLSASGARRRPANYAFAEDWRRLGLLIADCLGLSVSVAGAMSPKPERDPAAMLSSGEQRLLKRLLTPSRRDQLDAESIQRAIDDLLIQLARANATRAGTLILSFDSRAGLAQAIYDATGGVIAIDEVVEQQKWVQADLQSGATVLAAGDFDPEQNTLRVVTENMVYELRPSRPNGAAAWDHAICFKITPRTGNLRVGGEDQHDVVQLITVARGARDAERLRAQLGPDALDWSTFGAPPATSTIPTEAGRVKNAMLIIQVIEAVVKALEAFPVEILKQSREDGRPVLVLRALPKNERDGLAKKLGLSATEEALRRLFEEAGADSEAKWRLSTAASLGASRRTDVAVAFAETLDHRGTLAYRFELDEELTEEGPWFLRGQQDVGSEQVIARRLRILKALDTRIDLAQMLLNPWRVRRASREALTAAELAAEAFQALDTPKKEALAAIWETLPSFFVVGPPGVGKTRLAQEVVSRRFAADRSTRMLVTAQGHDALDHLQKKIQESFQSAGLKDLLVVRSATPERRASAAEETRPMAMDLLRRLAGSHAMAHVPAPVADRVRGLAAETAEQAAAGAPLLAEARASLGAVMHLVLNAADVVISTVNSSDIEQMVETREQFDWVIVEEAARATGPELVGALMLSGRRLLIGDHRQLPAFDADRMVKILDDHSLVEATLQEAERLLAPLMRDGELDDIDKLLKAGAETVRAAAQEARGLLDPFRAVVEEDERLRKSSSAHRSISATLTEQRRMDPAIARIVSETFYDGDLTTSKCRAKSALECSSPVEHIGAFPASPVVAVSFRHVSSPRRGEMPAVEHGRPAWHNPAEIEAVVDVLRHLRAKPGERPTLAILAPYRAQVEKLRARLNAARKTSLSHLAAFASVRSDGALVGTVDSFQGNEADVVVLSLVRNNARAGRGALGFLQDRRRMNVALSRAKTQLVIVGSLEFLKEAVRGVNPDNGVHDLSFLTEMTNVIDRLAQETRGELPLAAVIDPATLRSGR